MAGEAPLKKYQFFEANAPKGGTITPNFPGGVGAIDFQNVKKNIPHFEEVAVAFGLGAVKGAILKNTFRFFETKAPSTRQAPQFPEPVNDGQELPIIGTSIFGTPVYSNLFIRAGSYNNNSGEVVAQYEDIRVDACIFEITREHNIIETDIQGRDNTVIEYISKKSWKVNCKGMITASAANSYPTDDMVQLILALDSNKSIQVDSWFLQMAGIYNLVIKKKYIPQEEGGMGMQKFEFDAVADYPVVLKLQK